MRFHLRTPHYDGFVLIPAETEVGDGTAFPWKTEGGDYRPLSMNMEGADDEGRDAVAAYRSAKGLPPIQPPPPTFADSAPVAKTPAAHLEMRKVRRT